jgi:hypothetical protein
MSYQNRAKFEILKSAATGSIGAAYAAIGTPLSEPAVVLTFKNQTNGDVIVSTDGVNDYLTFPANSYGVYDIRTNSPLTSDFMFPKGTQFYVKDGATASTTGTFYIEAIIITPNS